MTTWALIFYMSVGWGTASTGCPAVIEGFSSYEKCMTANAVVRREKQYDWGVCVQMEK